MFYAVVLAMCGSLCSPSLVSLGKRHMRYCENCGQIAGEARELLDEQREEVRILFFCCDQCADDHVAWLRLKRGILLLEEQP